MSQAVASRTIKFTQKGGTYVPWLNCPWGDLYQEYEGEPLTTTNIWPNFAVEQPEIYLIVTSSRSVGVQAPASVAWFFNGTSVTDPSIASLFQPMVSGGDHYLKIVGNLVAASLGAPVIITAVAQMPIMNSTDTEAVKATLSFPIQVGSRTALKLMIYSDDGKNMTIKQQGGSCILKCKMYQGGADVTSQYDYKWYKLENGTYVDTAVNGTSITINEADVNTYADYMVVALASGVEVARDTQGVVDASDPLDINPNPTPTDMTIEEGNSAKSSVHFAPIVVSRTQPNSTTPAPGFENALFYFTARDAAGNPLNKWQDGNEALSTPEMSTTAQATFDVTEAMCIQAGGDVSLIIETQA